MISIHIISIPPKILVSSSYYYKLSVPRSFCSCRAHVILKKWTKKPKIAPVWWTGRLHHYTPTRFYDGMRWRMSTILPKNHIGNWNNSGLKNTAKATPWGLGALKSSSNFSVNSILYSHDSWSRIPQSFFSISLFIAPGLPHTDGFYRRDVIWLS